MKRYYALILFFTFFNNFCFSKENHTYFNKIKIHILTNTSQGKHLGDFNQADAIQQALHYVLKKSNTKVSLNHYDVESVNKLIEKIKQKTNYNHIIIGIGSHGIKAIKQLKTISHNKNIFIFWAGHQDFSQLKDIINIANLIALPKHVLANMNISLYNNNKTEIMSTIGVAHTVNKKTLKQSINHWTKSFPQKKSFISVFLGGDAPDANNHTLYFPPNEAIMFAEFIAKKALELNAAVLICNGPRTGRYDPISGKENIWSHRNSEPDPTSKAFIETLEKSNVVYQFSNYIYGQPSSYLAFIAKTKMTDGICFVTGDSTSMVSTLISNFKPQSLYIMENSSMNDMHKEFVKYCYDAGIANIVSSSTLNTNTKVDLTKDKSINLKNTKYVQDKIPPLNSAQVIEEDVKRVAFLKKTCPHGLVALEMPSVALAIAKKIINKLKLRYSKNN